MEFLKSFYCYLMLNLVLEKRSRSLVLIRGRIKNHYLLMSAFLLGSTKIYTYWTLIIQSCLPYLVTKLKRALSVRCRVFSKYKYCRYKYKLQYRGKIDTFFGFYQNWEMASFGINFSFNCATNILNSQTVIKFSGCKDSTKIQ